MRYLSERSQDAKAANQSQAASEVASRTGRTEDPASKRRNRDRVARKATGGRVHGKPLRSANTEK